MNNEELVMQYQEGDGEALNKLIEANKGIVLKIAYKYLPYANDELDDLQQEGTLGLIAAVEKYNPFHEKKSKFITYAVYYIDRYIKKIVFGRSEKDKKNKALYDNCTSLNIKVGKNEDMEFGGLIEDKEEGYGLIEEKIFFEKLRKELTNLMYKKLTLQEMLTIQYRYGWYIKEMPKEDIRDILKTNKISNIEKNALRKLRNSEWAVKNAKEFAELGYINAFYLDVLKERGCV